MSIPSSGELSFSDINEALCRSVNSEISLASASNGQLGNFNNSSPVQPDGATPHSASEWYSYTDACSAGIPIDLGIRDSSAADACTDFSTDPKTTRYVASLPITVSDVVYTDIGLTTPLTNVQSWYSDGTIAFELSTSGVVLNVQSCALSLSVVAVEATGLTNYFDVTTKQDATGNPFTSSYYFSGSTALTSPNLPFPLRDEQLYTDSGLSNPITPSGTGEFFFGYWDVGIPIEEFTINVGPIDSNGNESRLILPFKNDIVLSSTSPIIIGEITNGGNSGASDNAPRGTTLEWAGASGTNLKAAGNVNIKVQWRDDSVTIPAADRNMAVTIKRIRSGILGEIDKFILDLTTVRSSNAGGTWNEDNEMFISISFESTSFTVQTGDVIYFELESDTSRINVKLFTGFNLVITNSDWDNCLRDERGFKYILDESGSVLYQEAAAQSFAIASITGSSAVFDDFIFTSVEYGRSVDLAFRGETAALNNFGYFDYNLTQYYYSKTGSNVGATSDPLEAFHDIYLESSITTTNRPFTSSNVAVSAAVGTLAAAAVAVPSNIDFDSLIIPQSQPFYSASALTYTVPNNTPSAAPTLYAQPLFSTPQEAIDFTGSFDEKVFLKYNNYILGTFPEGFGGYQRFSTFSGLGEVLGASFRGFQLPLWVAVGDATTVAASTYRGYGRFYSNGVFELFKI